MFPPARNYYYIQNKLSLDVLEILYKAMKQKIFEYSSSRTSVPDREIVEWLINNLDSPQNDAFFESMLGSFPADDDADGRRSTIEAVAGIAVQTTRARRWKTAFTVMAAASLAAVCLVLFANRPEVPQTWSAEYAAYGQTKCVTLSDNTRIWLHNDTKLVFPDHFNGTRTVFADGELYAEVNADKKHPFIIDTKGAKISVFGTQFNLSSYEDGTNIGLTLLSGFVEMDIPAGGGNLHFSLEPGDQLEVDRESGAFSKNRIDVSHYSLWKDSRGFYFHDKPLKDIVPELEEAFGVRIIVKDAGVLSTRYLAAFINNESLDAILGALNCDGKLKIRKMDNTYFIYPNN